MFIVFYSDKTEIANVFETSVPALALAENMSRQTGRDMTVLYNTPDGQTDTCCRYKNGEREIVGGYCLRDLRYERGRQAG